MTKKIAITQPYLFPYLPYFQVMNAVDEFVIYDDVQFISRGRINRNNILIDGEAKRFTISLSGASPNKLINEIEIFDDFVGFIKTLEFNYSKAPYKEQTMEIVKQICAYEDRNLARFIANSFEVIGKYIGVNSSSIMSSNVEKDGTLKGQEKIINICKVRSANVYINSIGGQELYDRELFNKNNLSLKFLKSKSQEYRQFDDKFVPDLSIIDVLMFNSSDKINRMLEEYDLI